MSKSNPRICIKEKLHSTYKSSLLPPIPLLHLECTMLFSYLEVKEISMPNKKYDNYILIFGSVMKRKVYLFSVNLSSLSSRQGHTDTQRYLTGSHSSTLMHDLCWQFLLRQDFIMWLKFCENQEHRTGFLFISLWRQRELGSSIIEEIR